MTILLQLSTKLQDLNFFCLSCKGAGAMHNSRQLTLHNLISKYQCMVKSSSQLYCQNRPLYYHKGRLVQHFHYLVHVVNLANAIRIEESQIFFFFAIDCIQISKAVCKAAGAMNNCNHVYSIRQLTLHADIHESKCGYYIVLFTTW